MIPCSPCNCDVLGEECQKTGENYVPKPGKEIIEIKQQPTYESSRSGRLYKSACMLYNVYGGVNHEQSVEYKSAIQT